MPTARKTSHLPKAALVCFDLSLLLGSLSIVIVGLAVESSLCGVHFPALVITLGGGNWHYNLTWEGARALAKK